MGGATASPAAPADSEAYASERARRRHEAESLVRAHEDRLRREQQENLDRRLQNMWANDTGNRSVPAGNHACTGMHALH